MQTKAINRSRIALLVLAAMGVAAGFQNCGKLQVPSVPAVSQGVTSTGTLTLDSQTPAVSGDCSFNSIIVPNGQTVPGYLSATPPGGTTCELRSKPRTCSNGVLGGPAEYQYERCDTSAECKAPRRYSYTLPSEVAMECVSSDVAGSGFKPLFNVKIPDEGKAIARAKVNFRNSNGEGTYYWAAYALVGAAATAGQVGDDICAGRVSGVKTVIGSGTITSNSQSVEVSAAQGRNPCVGGQVYAMAGATLDVWVEDPRPHCQGLDLGHVEKGERYNWTNSMTEITSLNVPVTTNRKKILIMSSIVGTPELNPNTVCGSETATIVAQVVAGGALDTVTQVIPASQGNGHLVLSPGLNLDYSYLVPKVSAFVGSNTNATTVFSGGPTSGGTSLSFVKSR